MKYVVFHVAIMSLACAEVFALVYYSHRWPHETLELAVVASAVLAVIPGLVVGKRVERKGSWGAPILYLGFVNVAAGAAAIFFLASDGQIRSARDRMDEEVRKCLADMPREPPRRANGPLLTTGQKEEDARRIEEGGEATRSRREVGSNEETSGQKARYVVDGAGGVLRLLYPNPADRGRVEEGLYQRVLARIAEQQAVVDRLKFGHEAGAWMLAAGAVLLGIGGGVARVARRRVEAPPARGGTRARSSREGL